MTPGALVCVGVGITLGAHIGARSRAYIERADVVFCALSDSLVEAWVSSMNKDVRSLQGYYREGASRRRSYDEMVEAVLFEVRLGRKVCMALYGHPGVFAVIAHEAIRRARDEGFSALMEAGVSSEDCLYADLGIDPADQGCQHYEATQFMIYQRLIDPTAYLVLWQIGLAGDRTLARRSVRAEHLALLVGKLEHLYPLQHVVTLYEAATTAIAEPRIRRVALADLASQEIGMAETLVVPPSQGMRADMAMMQRLEALDRLN
ncbi:SAM-dependent methyltransferase [Pseudoxanthomonas composti]|uniref:Tetrapyrrole methylase domain-containing protein n=1 Tax=Pseudoxanthomonas composti TaxID=2137479 RepID=A0A4Q1JYE7_9GAMM|nr:SAM-dependent methyltransferase [Pseudoxanthomonas composti]RXR07183.1 hypothetical protein EPA99_04485 [Pseudoxanthomonas composti]